MAEVNAVREEAEITLESLEYDMYYNPKDEVKWRVVHDSYVRELKFALEHKDKLINKRGNEIINLESKYKNIMESTKEMQRGIQRYKDDNIKLRQHNVEMSERIQKLEEENMSLDTLNKSYEAEIQNNEDKALLLHGDLAELKQEVSEIKAQNQKIRDELNETEKFINDMEKEAEQNMKVHKEKAKEMWNTYQDEYSTLLANHAINMGDINLQHQISQMGTNSIIVDLETKLKEQQEVIEELKKSQITKKEAMTKIMDTHKKKVGSAESKHSVRVNKVNTFLKDYAEQMQNGANNKKCLMVRSPRIKCSEVIQNLECFLTDFHEN